MTTVTAEVMARYEAVIGLEVHAQLETVTKAFCGCSTKFGDAPNSNTCPVCLGLPGALPVLNKRALELALRASLALNCTIQERSRFARKNYFYPDLPKGYQISMYELPLALAGWIEIEVEGETKRIGITRLHMEDDAGKSLHEGLSRIRPLELHRLQPLRRAADRNRFRARPAHARRGLRVPEHAEADPRIHGSERLQHGGRLAALRRQRERAAARRAEIRHQGGSEEPEFVPLSGARARIRNRAADRRDRIGRHDLAGNAAVERRRGAHRADALEGIRARLPLFPRSRSAAGDGIGGDDRRRAQGDARTARGENGTISARIRHYAVRRGRADGDARAGGLFRGGGEGRRAREGRRPTGFRASCCGV